MNKNLATHQSAVRRWAPLAAAALAVATCGGCQHRQESRVNGGDFRPEGETRSVQRFAEVQMAAGARTDATLRTYEFDCGDLNSLGRQKIDLLLKDDNACSPLVVYLDVKQDENYAARQESVTAYLKDRGLTASQVKLVAGPNTTNLSPTGPALRGKKLLDSGAPVALNPEPTGSAGGPPAGGK
jgi:hypothetical protein